MTTRVFRRARIVLITVAIALVAAVIGGVLVLVRDAGQPADQAAPTVSPSPAPRRRTVRSGGLSTPAPAQSTPSAPTSASTPSASSATPPSTVPPLSPAPTAVLVRDRGTEKAPTAGGIAREVGGRIRDPRLGGRIAIDVVDLATGRTLYADRPDATATPASTTKIATAVAVLSALAPDHRFITRVVAGAHPGEVVVVGGGDPTLSAAAPGTPPSYAGAARLADLATAVRRTRAGSGAGKIVTVVVDGGLFSGPAIGPGWDGDAVSGAYVAPITALTVDGGRARPGYKARSTQPDLAAGRAFAAALGVPGAAVVRGHAPDRARALGTVSSAPVPQLVAQMVATSDNTLAEILGRDVAVALHRPASFAGASAAVRAVLARHGVPTAGVRLSDTSGLSRRDALSPAALTAMLRAAAATDNPHAHVIFSQLPVGGYAGTLAGRYRSGRAAAAAGQVRAKTGTLTGVSSLAGVVQDDDGRVLAFAILADGVGPGGTLDAQQALDEIAAGLAGCGCR